MKNKELIPFLIQKKKRVNIISSIQAIVDSSMEIYENLKNFSFDFLSKEIDKKNIHGDSIKKLDLISNEIILNHLMSTQEFYMIMSEEMDDAIYPKTIKKSELIIAYDPLDGSSNIKNNQTLGSIFSIYKVSEPNKKVENLNIKNHIFSAYVLYSYTLTFVFCDSESCHLFYFDHNSKKFILCDYILQIPENSNIYSINDGYSNSFPIEINNFIQSLKLKNFLLRYSGTFISDIHQIILKGGIFIYPPTKKDKKGKLRLLYEIIPIVFLIKKIGGNAIFLEMDENNYTHIKNIEEIKIKNIHEKYGIAIGSKNLIEDLIKNLKNN